MAEIIDTTHCPPKPEDVPCLKSPCPDDFTIPEFPDKSYYSSIPKYLLDRANGIRNTAFQHADGEFDASCRSSIGKLESAKAEYKAAERKKEDGRLSKDNECKENKSKLFQAYIDELIALLPKGCSPGGKDTPLEERVPKDKLAISVAKLKEKLADESINYQNNLKSIEDEWADAECKWQKANISYKADICFAKKTKSKAYATAELDWRTEISKQLESQNK